VAVKLSPKYWTEFWSQQVPVKLAQSVGTLQEGTVRLVVANVGQVTDQVAPATVQFPWTDYGAQTLLTGVTVVPFTLLS
jgi:hypothetical protein